MLGCNYHLLNLLNQSVAGAEGSGGIRNDEGVESSVGSANLSDYKESTAALVNNILLVRESNLKLELRV